MIRILGNLILTNSEIFMSIKNAKFFRDYLDITRKVWHAKDNHNITETTAGRKCIYDWSSNENVLMITSEFFLPTYSCFSRTIQAKDMQGYSKSESSTARQIIQYLSTKTV